MPKPIVPIDINNFPRIETNCLGFALGLTNAVRQSQYIYNLDCNLPIAEAFLRKIEELGLKAPRLINSLEEATPKEFVLMVYDFTPYKVRDFFMRDYITYWDYHVVRREAGSNIWVHKPGWDEPPCEVEDWKALEEEFGSKYVLFAFWVLEVVQLKTVLPLYFWQKIW